MIIAGEEGQLEKNKELAKKYSVYDKVIFTGTIPYLEVPKYMSCMDICLIPFRNDLVSKNSLPLKLFEYMACEKPIISTKLPGVINAVGEIVLYASNASEFTDKILYLYNNEPARQALGIEGRKFVEKDYDWSVICSKLEKILEESAY
jgi:glycosyltransferase involved in cell wall biosynthesis